MAVAVYGGSFNPPHVAHAMVTAWLLWTRRVEAVWIVPVFRHAFEGLHDKALAPFAQRLSWCRAMARDLVEPDDPRLRVLDIEAGLPVPSFTIDTLRQLRSLHPDQTFQPVVGADVLPQLPRWREWEALQREFPPIVVGRAGFPGPRDSVSFPEISSSEVRRLLIAGDPVDHLLTARVSALLTGAEAGRWWA